MQHNSECSHRKVIDPGNGQAMNWQSFNDITWTEQLWSYCALWYIFWKNMCAIVQSLTAFFTRYNWGSELMWTAVMGPATPKRCQRVSRSESKSLVGARIAWWKQEVKKEPKPLPEWPCSGLDACMLYWNHKRMQKYQTKLSQVN